MLEEWEGFSNVVIPEDAGEVQRREMKRSFFAGAQCLLLLSANLANEIDDPKIYNKVLQNIHEEIFMILLEFVETPGDKENAQKIMKIFKQVNNLSKEGFES